MNDVLVKGGTLVDGTGKSAITGDIAFTNGRITEVGKDLGAVAKGCWVSTVVMATATSVLLPPDLTGASG
jgi:N-acyl-D-aspartate/D-glutamate deacylase